MEVSIKIGCTTADQKLSEPELVLNHGQLHVWPMFMSCDSFLMCHTLFFSKHQIASVA